MNIIKSQFDKVVEIVERRKKQLIGLSLDTKLYNSIKVDAMKNQTTIQETIRKRLALSNLNTRLKKESDTRNELLLLKIEKMFKNAK